MNLQYRYPEIYRQSTENTLKDLQNERILEFENSRIEELSRENPDSRREQNSIYSKMDQTPTTLYPSGRITMPPSYIHVYQKKRGSPHSLNLPNLFGSSRTTYNRDMRVQGEVRSTASPVELQAGDSTFESPIQKLTPSNQFNLIASDCLDQAAAAPKAAAMSKRFNNSLNSYLEAPIKDFIGNRRITKQVLNQTLKESRERKTNGRILEIEEGKTIERPAEKRRPKSSLQLLTLKTKFNKNFIQSENMAKKIKTGVINKPMLAPIPFKFGQSFKNKSEEERYLRNCSELFKLRTLLINDPSNARETLMSFLFRFLTKEEIERFTDLHVQRLVKAVLEFKSFDPEITMQQLINAIMSEDFLSVGLKFTAPDPNQEELMRLMGLGTNLTKKFQESLTKKVKVDMPPTTHQSLKLPVASLPSIQDFGDRGRLGNMIKLQINKHKKYNVGEYSKPVKLLSPRQTKLPITVQVEEFSEEQVMNECRIKYINKAKQELDVMKRNKLVLEHVIKERVKQKAIEHGIKPEDDIISNILQ